MTFTHLVACTARRAGLAMAVLALAGPASASGATSVADRAPTAPKVLGASHGDTAVSLLARACRLAARELGATEQQCLGSLSRIDPLKLPTDPVGLDWECALAGASYGKNFPGPWQVKVGAGLWAMAGCLLAEEVLDDGLGGDDEPSDGNGQDEDGSES